MVAAGDVDAFRGARRVIGNRSELPLRLDVWSRSLMGWIEFEALRFFSPGFADELVGCEAL